MSIQAVAWVLDHEQATTGAERLVLLSIANHADASGDSYPSIERIMREANLARRRSVTDALTGLVEKGLIERVVNGAPDTRIPVDRRPNLYRLTGVSQTDTPPSDRGVAKRPDGVSRNDTRTISEPSVVSKSPSGSHSRASELPGLSLDAPFDAFWALYPRKVDKGHARKAYPAAVKRAGSPRPILDGVERYARSVRGKEPRFIAHAATWLNGDRWLDEPEASTPTSVGHAAKLDTDRSAPSGVIDLRRTK